MKIIASLFLATILLVAVVGFQSPSIAQERPRIIIVKAQQMIESGRLEEAIIYLEKARLAHANNDLILALYGQALYENKQISQAEMYFMAALKVNPLNTVAKSYIEVIRETSAASISEDLQQLEEVTWDKVGDLVVIAFAFMLGGTLNNLIKRISNSRFSLKSRRLFLKGYYEDFADVLEIQLSTNELRPLRHSLNFMLKHKSMDESIKILEHHVNSNSNLETLVRMIRLSNENHST